VIVTITITTAITITFPILSSLSLSFFFGFFLLLLPLLLLLLLYVHHYHYIINFFFGFFFAATPPRQSVPLKLIKVALLPFGISSSRPVSSLRYFLFFYFSFLGGGSKFPSVRPCGVCLLLYQGDCLRVRVFG